MRRCLGAACRPSNHRAIDFPNLYICLQLMNSQFSFNLINFKTPDPPFPQYHPKIFAPILLRGHPSTQPNQFPTPIPAQTPALHIFPTLLNTCYELVSTYFDHFQNPRPTVSPILPKNFRTRFIEGSSLYITLTTH